MKYGCSYELQSLRVSTKPGNRKHSAVFNLKFVMWYKCQSKTQIELTELKIFQMHALPYFDGLSSDPNVKVRLKSKIGRAQNLAKLFQLQCVDICWKPIELLHICWWYWILMAKINNFATFACWRPPWGVMCWERLVGWQKHSIIGIFIGYFNLFPFLLKHRELLSSKNNFRTASAVHCHS